MREIVELAREAQGQPVVSCADGEVLEGLRECETVARLALARQLAFVSEAERRGLASGHGYRNVKALLQDVVRISGGDAHSRVQVARVVERRADLGGAALPADLPETAQALRDGVIGLEHARAVVDGLRKVHGLISAQDYEQAETVLVEQARVLGPGQVRTLAERLAYLVDQDGAFRDEERQFEDRELNFGVGRDGMTLVKGRLDRETGAKLRAVVEPLAAPRPDSNGQKDPRTPGQRNADALRDVLDIALSADRLPRAGGQRPHITVTVSLESLQRRLPLDTPGAAGVVETTGQALTAAQIRRLACDAEVLPMVLGGDGQPLDVGRSQRTAPPHLRAALLARDGACCFPGCDHPSGTGEAHHRTHWADGGATSLENLVMLCGHHHRMIHNQGWDIELSHGRPMFVPPSIVDPWRKPRPGNTPIHQLDLEPLIPA